MADTTGNEKRFGEIAVSLNLVPQEKLDRALVIQKMVFSRTKVHMAIERVLLEMGAVSQEQIDTILETREYLSQKKKAGDQGSEATADESAADEAFAGVKLIVSADKLSAYLSPSDAPPKGLTQESVKAYLADQGIEFGLVDDQELSAYLAQSPLPGEPFKVASGVAPVEGRPPKIIYHFDTDPLRIGTLKSDGTMDWKNRGSIPQVNIGDLLVEKTEGDPGLPGTNVYNQVLPPSRIRQPVFKCGKGAQKSEDGTQILAKVDGTPKLSSDGKVFVFGMLDIDGDIGVETGNIEFEGYVEAQGGVEAGYTVKAKGLRTAGIQDAVIEVAEDLVCEGGVYGSTIKVGGNMKASHIHNCTIEIAGDLVIKKELFDSTAEINGRLITEGKILASKIDAKKGVEAFEIGSPASKPCFLTVGIDRKYERDLAAFQSELEELESQKTHVTASLPEHQARLEAIEADIAKLTVEQDSYLVQKRQFEEQLRGEGPNPVEDDEGRFMLQEMIAELVEMNDGIDAKTAALLAEEDQVRLNITSVGKNLKTLDEFTEKCQEKIHDLDESLKLDPGLPEIKVSGTIYNKTHIIGPHKEMVVSEDMQAVRIAEGKEEPNSSKYRFKISNLR